MNPELEQAATPTSWVRVAGAAIEHNRVCMLQERAEIMAQAIARSPGSFEFYGALLETGRGRLERRAPRTFRHLKAAPLGGG